MKKMSLLQKILGVVACCLIVAVIAVGAHGIHAFVKGTAPATIDEDAYDFVFTGKITLLGEEYDVYLLGSGNTFQMNAGNIKNVMDGTCTFTEGQGWTFKFNDAMGTIVRSQYSKETKASSFIYSLDMGSRGVGNLRLSCEDPDFKAAQTPWNDIPSFTGTAAWFGGVVTAQAVTACDDAGNFRVFCTGGEVNEITGTYELADGKYIFTAADGTSYTAEKNADGLYAFSCSVFRPALASYGPVANATIEFVQTVLTVDE